MCLSRNGVKNDRDALLLGSVLRNLFVRNGFAGFGGMGCGAHALYVPRNEQAIPSYQALLRRAQIRNWRSGGKTELLHHIDAVRVERYASIFIENGEDFLGWKRPTVWAVRG